MDNEYTIADIVEIGAAQEVILGGKLGGTADESIEGEPNDFE
jgi:hypothetical protein